MTLIYGILWYFVYLWCFTSFIWPKISIASLVKWPHFKEWFWKKNCGTCVWNIFVWWVTLKVVRSIVIWYLLRFTTVMLFFWCIFGDYRTPPPFRCLKGAWEECLVDEDFWETLWKKHPQLPLTLRQLLLGAMKMQWLDRWTCFVIGTSTKSPDRIGLFLVWMLEGISLTRFWHFFVVLLFFDFWCLKRRRLWPEWNVVHGSAVFFSIKYDLSGEWFCLPLLQWAWKWKMDLEKKKSINSKAPNWEEDMFV